MTPTETESAAYAVLRSLRARYPDSPFLALGQTVFWDEPVKAVLRQLLDEAGAGGQMVVGVHDTDYFAKTRIRRAGAGRFALLPHNDGSTRDLWSAAGEVSTLFGSETYPRRHDFLRFGVPFDRLARTDPDGQVAFKDAATEAWGWRGLVYTGSRDLIVSRLPLKDVGEGILQMLAWGFDNALKQIGPDCCCNEAHLVADTVSTWCREYCQTHPDRFLTDLFQYVLPKIYCLLLRRTPTDITVAGTANLLRFCPETASLPRFRFVDLFIQPATRDLAIDAYNSAVAGSTIYTLDKFGAGAVPFDMVIPGRGRGTLRITPRVVFVETPQPIAIGLKQPITSIQELAAVLNQRLGDQITLVGKAVTLVSMLAQEFIFVFNEEGSLYVTRTRQLNDTLAANGVALDMRPILRIRYETWDAMSVGKSTIRLPQHLASTFGCATITGPEFAAGWRSVVDEQKALCAMSATTRKPRELLNYLHSRYPLDGWDDRLSRYNAAKASLQKMYSEASIVHQRLASVYSEMAELRARRSETQRCMGEHYRRTQSWTEAESGVRVRYQQELASLASSVRSAFNRAVALKAQVSAIERGEAAEAMRQELETVEREAQMARFELVRNALLTVEGLPHTNHRPSAWWLPMIDASGDWFRKIVSTSALYTEPLIS